MAIKRNRVFSGREKTKGGEWCYDCVNILCNELALFARGLMTYWVDAWVDDLLEHIAVSTPFPYHLRTHPLRSLCKLCSHCKRPI